MLLQHPAAVAGQTGPVGLVMLIVTVVAVEAARAHGGRSMAEGARQTRVAVDAVRKVPGGQLQRRIRNPTGARVARRAVRRPYGVVMTRVTRRPRSDQRPAVILERRMAFAACQAAARHVRLV